VRFVEEERIVPFVEEEGIVRPIILFPRTSPELLFGVPALLFGVPELLFGVPKARTF